MSLPKTRRQPVPRKGTDPANPVSFVACVRGLQRRSAQSGSEREPESHQGQKGQNFNSLGPGNSKSGSKGEEGEEGTRVQVKGSHNHLERKSV